MFSLKRIQQDFSRASATYDANAALQQHVLSQLLATVQPLSEHARILDAGCGTGQLTRALAGHEVVQLDIAHAMCVKASSSGGGTVNGSIASLPFRDGLFDVVFCSLVLQWVPHWQQAIEEMKRVLKPGGILAISTFGEGTLQELRQSFLAVDSYAHVSPFAAPDAVCRRETIVEHYPDLLSLMRHLKAIGARNKLVAQRKSLTTRRQMQAIEDYYAAHFGSPQGLPVTWEILYCLMYG